MKTAITEQLYRYAISIAKPEHHVLQALRNRSLDIPGSNMQITPDQGQFMAMLCKILNAKKYLEVGVFTGYSTLAVSLAMDDAQAISYAIDIDKNTMEIAKEYWNMANVGHKIKPIIGDGIDCLAQLIIDGHNNTFDMAFIDAKKSDYIAYFKHCYNLVRIGGIILIDNIFMHGRVVENSLKESVLAVDTFNNFLYNLDIDYCVSTIADGLTIVRKT